MNAPKDTRPFDLAAARAGAPYACRNGKKAEILKWDAKGGDCPIVGLVGDEIQDIRRWSTDGETAAAFDAGFALVMTPLGYIEGKPVWWDSEIIAPSGYKMLAHVWEGDSLDGARWPAPAKVYPETGMTVSDFDAALADVRSIDGVAIHVAKAIANAAIRHAIDNGQLPTKEAYDQVRADLLEAQESRAAYGMAVAEAVRDEIQKWMEHPTRAHAIGGSLAQGMRGFDLAAIIAKVPVSA